MPTIRILYDVEGWAFHRRAVALQRHAPSGWTVSLAPWSDREGDVPDLGDRMPDIVFCMPSSRLQRLGLALDRLDWDPVVIGSWTSGWPLWISRFDQALAHSDLLIVNHVDAWERMGRLPGSLAIANGVDDEFGVTAAIADRLPRVVWTGSLFHSGVKGYRSHVVPLMKRLRRRGIPTDVMLVDSYDPSARRSPAEMAEWYNSATVLVCASELEGTPNPCLEAAACGCTLVSTPVGNMPELIRDGVNGFLVEQSVDALFDGVVEALSRYEELATQMLRDIESWRYGVRAAEFYGAFERALDGARSRVRVSARSPEPAPTNGTGGSSLSDDAAGPRSSVPRPTADAASPTDDRVDLTDLVTVFVTTVGAPSYEACRYHLELQDSRFEVREIRDVAPLSAAFQVMLDDCRTPFYVQVDEDMLLYPGAVRTLYEWIAGSEDDVALCAGLLLDAHLRRTIYGVKIFRHAIVRDFPHADVEASESDQVSRLKAAGFRVETAPLVDPADHTAALGLHGTHWTPQSIFERYRTLERKRRRSPGPRDWVADHPPVFLERYLRGRQALDAVEGSRAPRSTQAKLRAEVELDLFAFLGAVAGSLDPLLDDGREKDFRTHASSPVFEGIREWVTTLIDAKGAGSETE